MSTASLGSTCDLRIYALRANLYTIHAHKLITDNKPSAHAAAKPGNMGQLLPSRSL